MTVRRALSCFGVCVVAGGVANACYSAGSGTAPPTNQLYYPEGLAVSSASSLPMTGVRAADGGIVEVPEQPGDVLYVANSDFDLQYNGGTLQSYDLTQVRRDTANLITYNLFPDAGLPDGAVAAIPFVYPSDLSLCTTGNSFNVSGNTNPPSNRSNGMRTPLGEACSPPVDSTRYFLQSATIGAFATDLQLSPNGQRLYIPVGGNATITWADIGPAPGAKGTTFDCGQAFDPDGRCNGQYLSGNTVDPLDSRQVTMPGEPFGMAQTQDGTAIAVPQEATQETSLLLSGMPARTDPSMQFVLEGVPTGGNGIVAVPHDPDAVVRCEDEVPKDTPPCVRQAFLETYSAAEVDLLRYYDDDGSGLNRPFLEREVAYPITVNNPGTDQRGIVVDETPRLVCKAKAARAGKGPGSPEWVACGQTPARVFIGSRSPASVIFGTIGGPSLNEDGTYDPDVLTILGSVPADQGVSRLYLAPVVDQYGHYALRLFVVCYDASTVDVFDPDLIMEDGPTALRDTTIYTGPGPFAMAFDPACTGLVDAPAGTASSSPLSCGRDGPFAEVAVSEAAEAAKDLTHFLVPPDPKLAGSPLSGMRTYRFGYLGTFTNSYLQVIDLDDSTGPPPSATPPPGPPYSSDHATYEAVVFTLGTPTPPLGS
jgi:hypothetical protein